MRQPELPQNATRRRAKRRLSGRRHEWAHPPRVGPGQSAVGVDVRRVWALHRPRLARDV